MNANDPTATSCCVCCKEIPLDAAFTGRRGVRRALLRAGVLSTFPGAGQHCDRNERRTERLRFAAVKLRQTTLSLRRLMSASNSAE